jgi:tetratricopeptide (TPR) repeat protein
VRKNEYKKLEELLKTIDGGVFSDAVNEFNQLESKIVFEHANPVESENMTWEAIAEAYREMISIADKNESFAEIHKDDIADCHGHLGYVLFMSGNSSEAEKHLALKVDMLKDVETYDLPNQYAFLFSIVSAQISFGNYYAATGEFFKAIEIWVEALKIQIEFILEHGPNVLDSTKTRAGFVGSMTPLLDAKTVNVVLQSISYTLEDYFNSEDADSAKKLFEENWETIKTIGTMLPQPAFISTTFVLP